MWYYRYGTIDGNVEMCHDVGWQYRVIQGYRAIQGHRSHFILLALPCETIAQTMRGCSWSFMTTVLCKKCGRVTLVMGSNIDEYYKYYTYRGPLDERVAHWLEGSKGHRFARPTRCNMGSACRLTNVTFVM